MQVFVTGATGYIGLSVADAFRRVGYEVWGLTRSSERAPLLARREIMPVIGSMQEPESYRGIAESCDVLIHCAADYRNDRAELDRQTVETLLAACAHGPQPKTLVYTSGCWVYGDTAGQPVDETAPLASPRAGAHRPALERRVLGAASARVPVVHPASTRVLVIRPANVYGRRGGSTGAWFSAAHLGTLVLPGDGRNHFPHVHVDDLATGYLLAVESKLSGEIFHFAGPSRSTLGELAAAAAKAAGYEGEIKHVSVPMAMELMGLAAQAQAMDQLLNSDKAARLLRWTPVHAGFIDDVQTYCRAWQAWQDGGNA